MNEFEKESSTMDMKEEMMSDEVDEVMDEEGDEEEEGDKILKEVLDEIGIGLSQKVNEIWPVCRPKRKPYPVLQLTDAPTGLGAISSPHANNRQPVALGEPAGALLPSRLVDDTAVDVAIDGPNGGLSDEDALQARLDALRR
jgi:charged multivesicular body protein 2A